ncbi:diguanylate cyclase [Marinobacter sp. CA1]|uniref:diguanylate cyclase n=1 Tax=Marinobacter sp. CA1 TaxID=2817656 RepID=UPI001D062E4D|nr:diguanylate cyclase [Marinobacter sp. CA1]UDL07078.1 GGDEF domain-containing protein [Marinobacter sp. CA1]
MDADQRHNNRSDRQWPLNAALTVLLMMLASMVVADDVTTEPHTPGAPVVIEDQQRIDLASALSLLEDPERRYTFEQVRLGRTLDSFSPLGERSANFGFTEAAWWVKFTLANPSDQPKRLFIRQDYPLIDHLDFWAPASDKHWQLVSTGDMRPFHLRPVEHRLFLFPVTLPPQSESTYYLRFESQGSMNIGLFAHSQVDLMNLVTKEYLALGVYYGGFIVLLFYNLFMFLTVRERAFAYYLVYLTSYGLYMSLHNGLSFQLLLPDLPLVANKSLLVLLSISLFGGVLFTRTILNTRAQSIRADQFAVVLQWASALMMLISLLLSYRWVIVPLAVLTVIACVHMFVLGLMALARGTGTARYYMIAFSALLIGVYIYMAKTFGLLPHNAFTQNAFQIGSLLEMVLLSLAVASRLNELKTESFTDALTQLKNRRFFNEQIAQEYARAGQTDAPLTLAVIDIDHFKAFNDSRGHSRGDAALKMVASLLKDRVRKPNTVCRYGGEEFVLILPDTSDQEAAVLTERVRATIEKETAFGFSLTVSIGFATMHPGEFEDTDCLFVAADYALYTAKASGRNRVVNYRECDLKRALDNAHRLTGNLMAQPSD